MTKPTLEIQKPIGTGEQTAKRIWQKPELVELPLNATESGMGGMGEFQDPITGLPIGMNS